MKEEIINLLTNQDLSCSQIARKVGVSRQYVNEICKLIGLSGRARQAKRSARKELKRKQALAVRPVEKFWQCVDKAGPILSPELGQCWLWVGCMAANGYGRKRWEGKTQMAHRVSYLLNYGKPRKPCICHKCDNPQCVRPDHLFEGTHSENTRDAMAKGRMRHGKGKRGFLPIEA